MSECKVIYLGQSYEVEKINFTTELITLKDEDGFFDVSIELLDRVEDFFLSVDRR